MNLNAIIVNDDTPTKKLGVHDVIESITENEIYLDSNKAVRFIYKGASFDCLFYGRNIMEVTIEACDGFVELTHIAEAMNVVNQMYIDEQGRGKFSGTDELYDSENLVGKNKKLTLSLSCNFRGKPVTGL